MLTSSEAVATTVSASERICSIPIVKKASSDSVVRAMNTTSDLKLLQRWYSQITTAIPGSA